LKADETGTEQWKVGPKSVVSDRRKVAWMYYAIEEQAVPAATSALGDFGGFGG